MITSAIIIVLTTLFSVGVATDDSLEENQSFNEFGMLLNEDFGKFVVKNIFNILASFVLIVTIFLIGRQLGGNSNIQKVFCLISYAMLPMMIGGILTTVLFFAVSFAFHDVSVSEYGSFQYVGILIYFAVLSPFVIWSIIITIKAIRIVNDFGIAKSVGVFVLASVATYLAFIPVNIILF